MRRRPSVLILAVCSAALVAIVGALPAEARDTTVRTVVGMRSVSDIWCGPDGSCLAVGSTPENAGAVVVLRAAGPIGPVRSVPGTSSLSGITCRPGGSCLAVGRGGGSGVVVEVRLDGTPGPVRAVARSAELHRVACPTATTCLATGGLVPLDPLFLSSPNGPVFTVIENGQPAPARPLPRGTRRAIGISCPSATTCLTVGLQSIGVLTNTNGTWSARVVNVDGTSGQGLPSDSISCPPASACTATASKPRLAATRDYFISVPAIAPVSPDGAVGPVQILRRDPGEASDISCVAGGTCTVVGEDLRSAQLVITDLVRGVPVTTTTSFQPLYESSAVSCVAAAACGVVVSRTLGDAAFLWHGPVPA